MEYNRSLGRSACGGRRRQERRPAATMGTYVIELMPNYENKISLEISSFLFFVRQSSVGITMGSAPLFSRNI
jgi:hypothetical protein